MISSKLIVLFLLVVNVSGINHPLLQMFDHFQLSSQTSNETSNFHCISDEDCSYHGTCNQEKTVCICNNGYTTYPSANQPQCNYEQKNQLTAFLLSFFLGAFGAGHFYIEIFGIAAVKLILGLMIGCLQQLAKKSEDRFLVCFYSLGVIVVFIWYIWDLVLFGYNKYPDNNGVGLKPW